MKFVRTTIILICGVLALGGCAVYEPYPAYPGPVVVGPAPVYGGVGVYGGRGWGWGHRHFR
ncbi:hypothetical protein [Azospirillum sp. sgz301742]